MVQQATFHRRGVEGKKKLGIPTELPDGGRVSPQRRLATGKHNGKRKGWSEIKKKRKPVNTHAGGEPRPPGPRSTKSLRGGSFTLASPVRKKNSNNNNYK